MNELYQTFNKIYLSLIKEVKKISTSKDSEIISDLKKNYKVFDKKSTEYLDDFKIQLMIKIVNHIFIYFNCSLIRHQPDVLRVKSLSLRSKHYIITFTSGKKILI